MNRNLLPLAVAVLLLAACRQQENESQLKEISAGFEKANDAISDKNRLGYESMREKLKDPPTQDMALVWLPRAEVVSRQVNQTKLCIEELKEALIIRSDSFTKSDNNIVRDLLENSGKGDELFKKLASFIDSLSTVFNSDEFISNQFMMAVLKNDSIGFHKHVPLLSHQYISVRLNDNQNSKEWVKNKFANSSPLLALAMLNKIESDVVLTEDFLINYCNSKVAYNFCGYVKLWVIGSLSSSCVKSGDTVEVTAGVGKFDDMMRPRITIDGISQRLNNKKVAVHAFIANGKPGKHSVPIKIEYIDVNGRRETATKELSYYIMDPK
ncbi:MULTISPECIES: hypothetical protein [Niastella]|uniref:Gliding motility-associated protein GldM N-terminal domain-containing protein n=1 Tax=Niastella soli TaxID=2821487 RepID=A0ABS3YNW7_9BACT|nr:hypothetical protein [Niastella soli]MBO9199583.1 hypothetical protein [Niastella soli]